MADTTTNNTGGLNGLDIPTLEGYVLLAEAADLLKVTRQHVYRLVRDNAFPSVRRVGRSNLYVVKIEDVNARIQYIADKKAAKAASAA